MHPEATGTEGGLAVAKRIVTGRKGFVVAERTRRKHRFQSIAAKKILVYSDEKFETSAKNKVAVTMPVSSARLYR